MSVFTPFDVKNDQTSFLLSLIPDLCEKLKPLVGGDVDLTTLLAKDAWSCIFLRGTWTNAFIPDVGPVDGSTRVIASSVRVIAW